MTPQNRTLSRRQLGPLERDTCRDHVVPRLHAAGWTSDQILEEHYFTDGRVVATPSGHHRRPGLRADFILELVPGLPVAVVEAKRSFKLAADGLQQAIRYAEILELPFAYSTNGTGIVEHDFDTGRRTTLQAFPSPTQLRTRYDSGRGLSPVAQAVVDTPFNRTLRTPDGAVKTPRYYQVNAINVAAAAIAGGQRRVLLTLATGTGKTFVAQQIVWKLSEGGWTGTRRPRVLYLADRNILIDQPIAREFRPVFGDAIWKVSGEPKMGREIYFALYQSIDSGSDASELFRGWPRDYFDLIIVDECHRGSAREESAWRAVLEYFDSAIQLGMTATPLAEVNVDTYEYFGDPVYEYSLARGIEDGFLAPYRVKRVVLAPDITGWTPDEQQLDLFGREIPDRLYRPQEFERVVSLLMRTRAIARHLTQYLRSTDPFAKTIVFCVDQEHAAQMREALAAENEDLVRQYPNYVARIVSDEGDVGREYLSAFVDPESTAPVIATTSRLLSTGVDAPTVRNVVLARPVQSMVEFKQIIGRGTRLFPDMDKLAFTIIDYVGATQLFQDPAFDGRAEVIERSEVDEHGRITEENVLEDHLAQDSRETSAPMADPASSRKYYVDSGEVLVTGEAVYVLDAGSSRPRIVSYETYTADQVRKLFPTPGDLRARWRTREGRDQVVAALEERGVSIDDLAGRTGLHDADPFDLLVYVAWNGPLHSRRERASQAQADHKEFWEPYTKTCQKILEQLLEKYAVHGLRQLDDLRILSVPPFTRYGSPVEIAREFGGVDAFHQSVAELQRLLYSA